MAKKIKLFNYLLAIILITTVAFAATLESPLKFAFTDPNTNSEGYNLWISDSAEGTYSKVVDIDGVVVDFPKPQPSDNWYIIGRSFIIEGDPNTTTTKYFKISAYGTDQEGSRIESGLSNYVSYDFVIPLTLKVLTLIEVTEGE